MTMEVRATAKFQRVSPRKARLVTDLITGKPAMGLKTRRSQRTDRFVIKPQKKRK